MLGLSSFSSRRSHLNSTSYRTLIRIFCLCLDEQIPASIPNPNPNTSFGSEPNENSQNLAEQAESIHDPNPIEIVKIQQETLCKGRVDGEDFEEGEIPGDFEDSNQHIDLVDECKDKKFEESSVSKGFDKNVSPNSANLLDVHSRSEENYSRKDISSTLIRASNQGHKTLDDDGCLKPDERKSCTPACSVDVKCAFADPDALGLSGENLKNLANVEKERSAKIEVVEVKNKKKRGPQTEDRKAKKKRAKKRKRAQKEREQGVKRLKLQPIKKPKEVKYCDFYLVGRCQKGDLCKFSHDTTPLTKSQPCKYLACDSCLKGDDCPFDHELSKYPCHNYMSKGLCIRGNTCKFSHKLPVTEGSSPTSERSKADSVLPARNRNLAEKSVIPPKEPMQIPNGIRFISFNKEPSTAAAAAATKRNDSQQDATSLVQNSIHVAECEKNTMRSSSSACSAATTTAARKSNVDNSSRSLQTEVSEASKILEEFLFWGAG